MIVVALYNPSNESITVQFGFSVKNKYSQEKAHCLSSEAEYCDRIDAGPANFAKRSVIVSALVEGTLVVEVQMRLPEANFSPPKPFIPKNPFLKFVLKMFG